MRDCTLCVAFRFLRCDFPPKEQAKRTDMHGEVSLERISLAPVGCRHHVLFTEGSSGTKAQLLYLAEEIIVSHSSTRVIVRKKSCLAS